MCSVGTATEVKLFGVHTYNPNDFIALKEIHKLWGWLLCRFHFENFYYTLSGSYYKAGAKVGQNYYVLKYLPQNIILKLI